MIRRRLVILIAALASFAAPAAAEAATLSRDGNTIVFTDTAGDVNIVSIYKIDGSDDVWITDENTNINGGSSGCVEQDPSTFTCSNVEALRMLVGGANDEVRNFGVGDAPADVPMTVEGGDGGDFVYAGPNSDDLRGGPGADTLTGNGGNDTLDGGFGGDYMEGGADGDVVTYAARTEPIEVDFTVPGIQPHQNGSFNDGPAGARDHIRTVETVVGGSGNDNMRAGTDAMTFRGGAGNDTLTGSPGAETLDRGRRRGHRRRTGGPRHGARGRRS